MNDSHIRFLLVATLCLVTQGCSSESKEEKQARVELEAAGTAISEKNFDLAMKRVNESLRLHPFAGAYGIRSLLHMKQNNYDEARRDVNRGLALEPDNKALIKTSNHLSRIKRTAKLQKMMRTPSLSDVYKKAHASEHSAREALKRRNR